MLDTLHRFLQRVSLIGVWVCGAGFLLVSLMVFGEVVARNFLGSRMSGSGEIAGYVFAISVSWGFSYCLFERSHVRIDFLYQHLPAPVRAVLDVLSILSMTVFSAVLAAKAWGTLQESLQFESVSTTHLQTPLWIPQSLWAVGFVLFALNAVFLLVYSLWRLLQGRVDVVDRIAGVPHGPQ